jgi:phosphatidylglycerophosphate synthase
MTLRKNSLVINFYHIIEKALLPRAKRLFKTPYHFTVLGLVLALIVPFGFYIHPFFGFFFITFSGLADVMDGLLAKNQKADSVKGAFLDSSFDRISDFLYLLGFGILFLKSDRLIWAGVFILLGILSTFMISYVKARAEGLGVRCEKGLMERGLRTIYLIVWALLLSMFPTAFDIILLSGVIFYCVFTVTTFIQRILHIMGMLA